MQLDAAIPYRELRDPALPDELRTLALDCFAAQRAELAVRRLHVEENGAASAGLACDGATREPADAVSPEALAALLASGRTVGGIVSERSVATAIPFNARHANDVVWSKRVAAHRRRLDRALARWIPTLFASEVRPLLFAGGHWWYPPGTYFGWHTNQAYPGWRLYLSHAEDEGRSFFRYRHPDSGEVVTSPDGRWDLRLFEVSAERLFWHAVYSDTHRFSVGWVVRPWSLTEAVRSGVKYFLPS